MPIISFILLCLWWVEIFIKTLIVDGLWKILNIKFWAFSFRIQKLGFSGFKTCFPEFDA